MVEDCVRVADLDTRLRKKQSISVEIEPVGLETAHLRSILGLDS